MPTVRGTVCAVVVNEHGEPLAYTCQSTMSMCEEWAQQNLLAWDKMKELGYKVVQAELFTIR